MIYKSLENIFATANIGTFNSNCYLKLKLKSLIMKVLIDIQDNKAAFIMELLNSFSFVKAKPITKEKALLIEEIKEAVENVKLAKQGKLKAQPLNDLLNEL